MSAPASLLPSQHAALKRAYELYDGQPSLISRFEFDGRIAANTLAKAITRQAPKVKAAALRIETHPDDTRVKIATMLLSLSNKSSTRMPRILLVDEPIVVVDPTNEEILRLERQLHSAKQDVSALKSKLSKSHEEGTLFLELADVIRESAEPLPPVHLHVTERPDTGEFDLVLILSDEHADQVVTSAGTWGLEQYDFNIFRCRLQRLLEQTINYVTVHLPQHKFGRLWVFKLGDAVNGDIHGSGTKNFFKNTIKAALATGDVEAQFVQALVPYFPGGVHVVGVSGNHPRRSMRKDYGGPQDNFDYLVVAQIAARLAGEIEDGRVTVHTPDAWTAFVEVRGKLWALNHGDDVKGFAGHPWYGFDRKNNRVQAMVSRFDQKIDFFAYGHYHTDIKFVSAGATSIHSGAWPMTDPFALNALSAGNEPVQTLYVVGEGRGINLTIPIYTRDVNAERAYRAGEWAPTLGETLTIDRITEPLSGFAVIKP